MPSKQGARLHARLTNTEHPKCDLLAVIDSHPLNAAVQLIVPHEDTPTSRLAGVLQEAIEAVSACGYLVASSLLLGDAVRDVVTSGFKPDRQGPTFQALLLGPSLDLQGGACCITHDGCLRMAVSRELHAQLGIVGQGSAAQPGEGWWGACTHSAMQAQLVHSGCLEAGPTRVACALAGRHTE